MIGIIVANSDTLNLDAMDKSTRQWELSAARGDCAWICADCCQSFSTGMPDKCCCGHAQCTALIQRDKEEARREVARD